MENLIKENTKQEYGWLPPLLTEAFVRNRTQVADFVACNTNYFTVPTRSCKLEIPNVFFLTDLEILYIYKIWIIYHIKNECILKKYIYALEYKLIRYKLKSFDAIFFFCVFRYFKIIIIHWLLKFKQLFLIRQNNTCLHTHTLFFHQTLRCYFPKDTKSFFFIYVIKLPSV